MIPALRVKVKSLATEAVYIRAEERKALSSARWQMRNGGNDFSVFGTYHSLRAHRVFDVRQAARSAQLAYAFLRGKPYRLVERVGSTAPSWKDVAANVKRFSPGSDPDAFERWRNAM